MHAFHTIRMEKKFRREGVAAMISFLLAAFCSSIFLFQQIPIFSPTMLVSAQDGEEETGKPGWIGGRYFISRRKNVVGATVKLVRDSGDDIYLSVTDENGRWNFRNVPEGKYRIEIFKEGFAPIIKDAVMVQFPFKAVIELQAARSKKAYGNIANWSSENAASRGVSQGGHAEDVSKVRIAGSVVMPGGDPLMGARITAKDIKGKSDPYTTVTNAKGDFFIEDVKEGFYDLSISSFTYFTMRVTLDVREDMNLQAIAIPQPQGYQYTPSELIPQEEPLPPEVPAPPVLPPAALSGRTS